MNKTLQSSNPGFYNKMYDNWIMNINIHGKGGVIASPDRNTPGGNYWFHWARDAALVMRTFMEVHDYKYEAIVDELKSYVDWCLAIHKSPETE